MPFQHTKVVTFPDEVRVEVVYTVEKRERLKITESASREEEDRIVKAKVEEIKRILREQIKKELNLGEVKLGVTK